MPHYRIRRLAVSSVFPFDTQNATQAVLADGDINGKLVGVVLALPTFTDTESINVSEHTTITESHTP